MNRDYAEKQDLWAEMSELWMNRQSRRRKLQLSVMALVSLLIMGAAFLYTQPETTHEPLYRNIQGQTLRFDHSIENGSAVHQEQREVVIETTETLSI